MQKLIWTTKELLVEMNRPLNIDHLPPIARVIVPPQEWTVVRESSAVAGVLNWVIIYLPPGVQDLVWVSISLNDRPLVAAVGGDNQYHSIMRVNRIEIGDIFLVVVKNFDSQYGHSIGVRVEVEEE